VTPTGGAPPPPATTLTAIPEVPESSPPNISRAHQTVGRTALAQNSSSSTGNVAPEPSATANLGPAPSLPNRPAAAASHTPAVTIDLTTETTTADPPKRRLRTRRQYTDTVAPPKKLTASKQQNEADLNEDDGTDEGSEYQNDEEEEISGEEEEEEEMWTEADSQAYENLVNRYTQNGLLENIRLPPLPPSSGETALQAKYGFITFPTGRFGPAADAAQNQNLVMGRLIERMVARVDHLHDAILPPYVYPLSFD
jgi:hypothetical protein